MFRNDFVWGVASSAYQVEGTDPVLKRGKCIWDTFSEADPFNTKGGNGLTACDHMHKYKEDFAMMKELGIKAYRFSINWCRIIPDGVGAAWGALAPMGRRRGFRGRYKILPRPDYMHEGKRYYTVSYAISLGSATGSGR